MTHACPICGAALEANPRYPNYVCGNCAKRAMDASGRVVEFSNVGLSGGLEGRYHDTHEPYTEQACYIDGIACRADEARFGGIVIEVLRGSAREIPPE